MRKKERNWDESNEAFNSIDLTVKLEEKFACMKTADCLLEFDMAIWTIRCQVNILTIRINLYLLTVLLRQFDFGNGIITDWTIIFTISSNLSSHESFLWNNCTPPGYHPDTCRMPPAECHLLDTTWMPPGCHLNVQYQEFEHLEVNHLSLHQLNVQSKFQGRNWKNFSSHILLEELEYVKKKNLCIFCMNVTLCKGISRSMHLIAWL